MQRGHGGDAAWAQCSNCARALPRLSRLPVPPALWPPFPSVRRPSDPLGHPACFRHVAPCRACGTAGLLGFPPKDLQYRFLSQFRPVFYIRQRDYAKVGTTTASLPAGPPARVAPCAACACGLHAPSRRARTPCMRACPQRAGEGSASAARQRPRRVPRRSTFAALSCRAWLCLPSSSTTAAASSASTRGPGRCVPAAPLVAPPPAPTPGHAQALGRQVRAETPPVVHCPVAYRPRPHQHNIAAGTHGRLPYPSLLPLMSPTRPDRMSAGDAAAGQRRVRVCGRGRHAAVRPGRVQERADGSHGAGHRGRGVHHGIPALWLQGAAAQHEQRAV